MSDSKHLDERALDLARGKVSDAERVSAAQHLAECAECRAKVDAERALDAALAKRTLHAAPASLRAALATSLGRARAAAAPNVPRRSRRSALTSAFVLVGALALGLGFGVVRWESGRERQVASEAVSDHLRILYAERPLEVESGGMHQVRPWFTGRLDFAPPLAFNGDDEFRLQGGAVAYFIDRKAAAFIFKHALHTITLFVFRSDGLSWPLHDATVIGPRRGTTSELRGFRTLVWRDQDLGYALVSDVDAKELVRLGERVVAR